MAQDFNSTINLPKTEFSMRGNLVQKEPAMLEDWAKNKTYYKMIEKNSAKPKYVLHDGPPYANGDIHMGTALNKVLKDIIVRYKNMNGYCSPYIPGWDTHGLPIELKALKALGVDKGAISPVELRKHCHEYALTQVENQKKQFVRLGVWGDFDDPYLTLKPGFEANEIEVFGEMYKKGYIYKGLKPVYWCPDCQTALAEAEIEYANDPCHSIYVKFKVSDDKGKFTAMGLDLNKTFFVIWTTTTWTLPGNLAICLGPDYEYTVVKANGENYIMAAELVKPTMEAAKIENYTTEGSFTGKELEYMKAAHPFMGRDSLVIVGDHVTLESGTGCVHTAPGFGVDDFEVCKKYPEIGIVVPVDAKGIQTAEAGKYAGLSTTDSNKIIAKDLEESGALFALEKIVHQYPHCWRWKNPILFRETEQWVCSVKGFKDNAIENISKVQWIPEWGEERIKGMVNDRSDWCISRQRTWGVPIPVFYCKDCGKPIVTDETIKKTSDLFRKEGSDAWYIHDVKDLIPEGLKCECGCTEFVKETDIFDVWFDSGVTHKAVMEERGFDTPVDLYLEGADQYRGWFQSSLLTSSAIYGRAPYKAVCTHGWVVDGEGKTMHKSLGNGVDPSEITDKYGADILRLWVASSDYHADVRFSNEILKQLTDTYKKIRNTARYILGNLGDSNGFNVKNDIVPVNELHEIDKWALLRLNALIEKCKAAYDAFDFHVAIHGIHNFCVTDMSNFYLDIIKDRLYCTGEKSADRRAAQTAMYYIISALSRLVAPVLAFTAEEIWKYMPHSETDDTNSVMMNDFPTPIDVQVDDAFVEKWNFIYQLRADATKALEVKRADKFIGASLEAKVIIHVNGDASLHAKLDTYSDILAKVFIVSGVEIVDGGNGEFKSEFMADNLSYDVAKADGEKCERCWIYSKSVGKNALYPTLCDRCAEEVAKILK
ncbi:MAG: isoleucine--tRNA ligase [Oscillospiraceae bacterium]|nr:isoleucine--tRNA ligase [Oscillospiraceae bacterium]